MRYTWDEAKRRRTLERRGLDFIRAGLPNHDPYRAWANFEFQTPDGAIYEVDLLVLTKQGFWLVEIKSWPGRVRGDAGTWTRTHEGQSADRAGGAFLGLATDGTETQTCATVDRPIGI